MGTISAGQIIARIGADTSSLQAGLRDSGRAIDRWGSETTVHFGRASESVRRMGISVQNLYAVVQGGASATQLIDSLLSQVIFKGGPAALVVIGLATAYKAFSSAVRQMQTEANTAGKPAQELATYLAGDAEAFGRLVEQAQQLIAHFKLSGPEWTINTERTVANAAAILALTDRIKGEVLERKHLSGVLDFEAGQRKHIAEQVAEAGRLHQEAIAGLVAERAEHLRFLSVWGQYTPASVQINEALAKGAAAMVELGNRTRESYGILSASDVATAAANLVKELQGVAVTGGTADQVIEKMGPTILSLAAQADKMGVDVGGTFTTLAEDIKSGATWSVEALMERLKHLPDAAKAGTEASRAELDDLAKRLQGAVSGGWGRGAEEGTNYARQQTDAYIREVEGRTIKLQFDIPDLQALIRAAISGRIPATGYSAP